MQEHSRFIRACRGEVHDTVPVWFMRQAGRYQPSYRALRQKHSMLEIARTPTLLTEVTVRPVEELGVDAAILFSDIMIPLKPMGIDFDIKESVGPVVFDPIRSWDHVQRLTPFVAADVEFVLEGIERAVERLGEVPLIGFSGAPFTLASYAVEGGPSRDYRWTKRLLWTEPKTFHALMTHLADMVIAYLTAQIAAGAAAIQIFDSWVGSLSSRDYVSSVHPHMVRIFEALKPFNVPLIYFGVVTQHLLPYMKNTGATVLGVDWRTPLIEARRLLGSGIALQGNLDPERLISGMEPMRAGAHELLDMMGNDPAYIFNLRHGVPQEADPNALRQLVEWIHAWGKGGAK